MTTLLDILGCAGVAGLASAGLAVAVGKTLAMLGADAGSGMSASAGATRTPAGVPDDTLIEIGDAVFTAQEVSKIADLATYYQGRPVRVMTGRGQRTGGDAA